VPPSRAAKGKKHAEILQSQRGRRRVVGTPVERDYYTERHQPTVGICARIFLAGIVVAIAGGRAGGRSEPVPTTHAPVWTGSD
jgi:hypothetical protein